MTSESAAMQRLRGRVASSGADAPEGSGHPIRHLLMWQMCALATQVAAVWLARHNDRGLAESLSYPALALAFGSALWVLTRPDLARASRNAAVACLGLAPLLMWRSTNPLLFTGFDEQLHMRTLVDIISSKGLFQANPLLEVSARYPGLEATTSLLCQLGIPPMAAALAMIVVARLVLVSVLCDAVEQLTGSVRAGGLAVAVYSLSPQFVFFNSQFSYQTLALPLALAAVSFIARARIATHPIPLLAGSTVCLASVAMTHHMASFVTTVLLLLWATAERGPGRARVVYGALAAVAATLAWAMLQRSMLANYFGPIIDDVRSQIFGGARRPVFSDSAGAASTVIDRVLLLYYAAALALVLLVLTSVTLRRWRRGQHHWHRGRSHRLRWEPHLLVLSFVAMTPVLLAARVLPKGGELFDRGSSFLFLPVSLFVAGHAAAHWWPSQPAPGSSDEAGRGGLAPVHRAVVVALAAGVFLGGYVLGSGPSWARLPGPYMVAADTRSMDAETLAAVEWADDALPDGCRIGADRVSSVLLAAKAGVWPVMTGPGDIDVPALYVADKWDRRQTEIAASMRLRYLYVDRRLASERPHFGSYFFQGETGSGQQFTETQLTKFAATPGIATVYRHGPVSIYDLKGLGIPELRSGWFGTTRGFDITRQVLLGLLTGLLVAFLLTSPLVPALGRRVVRFRRLAGSALTAAAILAVCCLASVGLLLAGFWVTPLAASTTGLTVAVVRFRTLTGLARASIPGVPRRDLATIGLLAAPLALIIAVAVNTAADETIGRVEQILSDRAAIHVPAPDRDR